MIMNFHSLHLKNTNMPPSCFKSRENSSESYKGSMKSEIDCLVSGIGEYPKY